MSTILVSQKDSFLPIIKALHRQGHNLITTHPQFAQTLRDLDIPAKALAEFSNPGIQAGALNISSQIIRTYQPPANSFAPGALEFMQQGLGGFLYPRLADVVSFAILLETVKPDLILVHNDVEPLLRAASSWGESHGIPVLHVPHAIYLDIEKGQPGDDIHDSVTASHIAVAGWFQREWYEKRGGQNITETGLPQFDKMATVEHNPVHWKRQLQLDPRRPVVTYASSWRQDTNLLGCHSGVEDTYLAMLEVIKRLPEVQFIIKIHPHGNNGQWHVDQAKQAGVTGNIQFTQHHLEQVLQASDLVMTYSGSNLLLEAAFFPWVRLAATQGYESDPEVAKINTDPPNVEAMIEAIAGSLSKSPAGLGEFQRKYVGKADGRAGERIAGLIEGLLR